MFILTQSGRRFDFDNPTISMVDIEDIAYALSWINRYTGHAHFGYSVLEHSLAVAEYLRVRGFSVQDQVAGLLHDAHEAYYGDISSPVKKYLDIGAELKSLGIQSEVIESLMLTVHTREDRVQDVVGQALNIPSAWMRSDAVKQADHVALAVEREHLLPADKLGQGGWPVLAEITPEMCVGMPIPVEGVSKLESRAKFVALYERLRERSLLETMNQHFQPIPA